MSDNTEQRMLEVTAKSIAVYYAAEKAFMADPTPKTYHAFLVAAERYTTLRDELRRVELLLGSIEGTKKNESVGR